jgi:radical SAM superfamily enzyme YgiQ (UPF0313 family)
MNTEISKRVLLISFDLIRDNEPAKSLSSATILANLKYDKLLTRKYSFEHQSINMLAYNSKINKNHFKGFLGNIDLTKISFLFVSAYIWNEYFINDFLCWIKLNGFNGKIILGGYQITYSESITLHDKYPKADYFLSGFAEESIKQFLIVDGNLGDSILKLPIKFEDLKSPYLEGEIEINPYIKSIRWETKRGCPYNCSFCAHKDNTHKRVYKKLAENAIRELDLFQSLQLDKINVVDPIFNMGNESTLLMKEINSRNMKSTFSLQTRLELINKNDEFLNLAEKGNYILEFGIQTMIESESKSITRKNNIEKMIDALRNVFDRQIPYEISLIYGLPGQTLNSFRRSIDILHDIGIYDIVAFPLMLLPGTQLYLENEKWGMNEEVLGDFNIPLVTSSNSFTRMEWEEMDRIASNLNSKVRFR